MKTRHQRGVVWVIALALFTLAACSGSSKEESTSQYFDSSVMATKVRAAIVADPELSSTDIDVATFKDRVQLSGFVDSAAAKSRAGQVARSVDGVRVVDNNLIVK